MKSWIAIFLSIFVMSTSAIAEEYPSGTEYTIYFRVNPITPSPGIQPELISAIEHNKEPIQGIIQLEKDPNSQELNRIKNLGVTFPRTSYIGGHAYFVYFEPKMDIHSLNVRWAGLFKPESKIMPEVYTQRSNIIVVVFCEWVSEERARKSLINKGEIKGFGNDPTSASMINVTPENIIELSNDNAVHSIHPGPTPMLPL